MYVSEYMTKEVISISPDTLVTDAMRIMQSHGIRRLPVVQGRKLVGLVTQDTLRELGVKDGIVSANFRYFLVIKTKVVAIMVKNVITVPPDTSIEDCAALGQQRKIGTLPVVDRGRLVGIITTTDLFKILTNVLGFGKRGIRLHLVGGYKDRPLGEVTSIVYEHGVQIESMFSLPAPATGRNDLILHLDADDPKRIVADMEAQGYTVEARVHGLIAES